jgi:hypothetical protein
MKSMKKLTTLLYSIRLKRLYSYMKLWRLALMNQYQHEVAGFVSFCMQKQFQMNYLKTSSSAVLTEASIRITVLWNVMQGNLGDTI